jgi:hypothetical protein
MSIGISQLVISLSSTILADIAGTSTTHMTTNFRKHIPLIYHKLKNSILLNPLFLDLRNANTHISIMPCIGERFDCKK